MSVRHEPMFGHEHSPDSVPDRLGKMDPAWLFVLALVAGGFAFRPLWVIAGLIAFFRVVGWSGHGFPMTTRFWPPSSAAAGGDGDLVHGRGGERDRGANHRNVVAGLIEEHYRQWQSAAAHDPGCVPV